MARPGRESAISPVGCCTAGAPRRSGFAEPIARCDWCGYAITDPTGNTWSSISVAVNRGLPWLVRWRTIVYAPLYVWWGCMDEGIHHYLRASITFDNARQLPERVRTSLSGRRGMPDDGRGPPMHIRGSRDLLKRVVPKEIEVTQAQIAKRGRAGAARASVMDRGA